MTLTLEQRLITDVASNQETNKAKLRREKDEISQFISVLKKNTINKN